MPAHRPPSPPRRPLIWLLCLALLLPLAQTAAVWHGYSHGVAEAAAVQDPQAPHAEHCDVCLMAAAITGGALAFAAPVLALATARHEPPWVDAGSVWATPPPLAYRSRAPPSVPC